MKIEDLKTDISKMSDDELREFILENRRAQARYSQASKEAPKRAKVSSITESKKKEDKARAMIESMDPEILKKLLAGKGIQV